MSETENTHDQSTKRNPFAVTGLILGILSIIFYKTGMLPIAAIVVNVIALSRLKEYNGKGKIQAIIGLILVGLLTVAYIVLALILYGGKWRY